MHEARDGCGVTPNLVNDGHRILGLDQQVSNALQDLRVGLWWGRGRIAVRSGQRQWGTHHLFLQAGVVAYVDRSLRVGLGNTVGAQKGLRHTGQRVGLIIPLDVIAHERTLYKCRVDPINPGASLHAIHGPGGAQGEDGGAVTPGIEQGHAGVLQAHDVVQQGGHQGATGLGIAMRHGHGDFFVTALDQFRHAVAAIIDDGVVETAKAGTRIAGGIGNAAGMEHIDDHIGTILRPSLRLGREYDITDYRHAGSPLWQGLSFCYCACCLYMLQE